MDYKGIINETVNEVINRDNHKKRILRDKMFINLFKDSSINEVVDNEKRNDVIDKLKRNDFEKDNPQSFYDAMMKSKHMEMLSPYSLGELREMKLFKLHGYDIGFALKKTDRGEYDEIVSVFNNEDDVTGIGKELVNAAVRNGGCYLDHYDGFLSKLYSATGFIEYDRYEFDPQYDPDGSFREKYGELDVIFRKHKDC